VSARFTSLRRPACTGGVRSAASQRFLSEVSRTLGQSIDYEATLRAVARLAVPELCDWCVVDIIRDDGTVARVAIEHRDPLRRHLAERLRDRFPPMIDAPLGPGHVLRTHRLDYQSRVPLAFVEAMSTEPERLQLLRDLGLSSYICAPLKARGHTFGAISLFMDTGRHFGADDCAVAEDLTHRAALAIDNARLYKQAQLALRARDEMLAVVSHDLRTMLSTISMAAAVQIATAPNTEEGRRTRQHGEVFQRTSARMARLVSDLTDLVEIETGRFTIMRRPQDSGALVLEAIEAFRPAAAACGAALHADIPGHVPRIACDRDRIVQVLSNLISNAMKAGAPTITLGLTASTAEIVFVVSDTGPGIPQDDVPHMFDRYWRGQTARYRGTGLGLAIAKGIIEAHGGRIWITSTIGRGTTVSFTLPR
jgi:signal transduction histidine kinase